MSVCTHNTQMTGLSFLNELVLLSPSGLGDGPGRVVGASVGVPKVGVVNCDAEDRRSIDGPNGKEGI